ncbi:MAG TPA: glutathione S-transferase family protein [Candidatus Thermoplasmatota archaeon]|nr:glutathione S-transferase family protein [Candidatus Thermoplasmatota archaeon]
MAAWRLYGRDISHFVVAAQKMLDLKRIPYEPVYVPYHDPTKLLAASGQDYVPWLETAPGKGVAWYDIPDFLEKERPQPSLYPAGTRGRARLVEDWAHQVVEEAVWKYVVADAVPTFRDPIERWVFVEMQERRRGPLEAMAARKPEFLEGVRHVARLSEDLLGANSYLLGDAPSLADAALWGSFSPLWKTGNEIPKEFARLREWQERVAKLA